MQLTVVGEEVVVVELEPVASDLEGTEESAEIFACLNNGTFFPAAAAMYAALRPVIPPPMITRSGERSPGRCFLVVTVSGNGIGFKGLGL